MHRAKRETALAIAVIIMVASWLSVLCCLMVKTASAEGPDDPPPLWDDVIFGTGEASALNSACPYMIGKIAVAIIFPESIDGSEDWALAEQSKMLSEIGLSLDWWTARAAESGADITWVHEIHMIPTIYEPIERPHGDYSLWIPDVLQEEGEWWQQDDIYVEKLRQRHDADWGFIIFVIDSSEDVDGMFADRFFAFARHGGGFLVITYDNWFYGPDRADRITAHEIGHIFCALDQAYSAHQPCEHTSGYLDIPNQNSEYGECESDVPSIMRYATTQAWEDGLLDDYARGQVGWWDADCDDILDPVDPYIDPEGCVAGSMFYIYLPIVGGVESDDKEPPVRPSPP